MASVGTTRMLPGRTAIPLAWLVAASLSLAIAWAIVSPALQAPDENAHFGYVQTLAETGDLPGAPGRPAFSTEQARAAELSNADQAAAQKTVRMQWDPRAETSWERRARALPERARQDGGGTNPASSNPPLYYLWETPAYLIASSGDFFDRLFAMRVASLLWLALTVVATWLLVGEVLGRDPLLQLAAAGLAGLAPMMTFVSASVSPDAMLFAVWTLALWLGVRTLKRGLTPARAATLFAAVGAAIVVKASSYALLPGAVLVLAVGAWRKRPTAPALAIVGGAAAGALALTAGAWYVIARLADRPPAAQISGASATTGTNVRELLSYLWQFYLPKLPFQTDWPTIAPHIPVFDIWIRGVWGAFGWTEVTFPAEVYGVLALLTAAVLAAAGLVLWRTRRSADLAVGAFLLLTVVSLLAGLHWSEYRLHTAGAGNFNQGRYLLPLVGIAGLLLATGLSALAPARRALGVGAALGGLLVMQAFSLGLVLERFHA
jgi:4-amino-4-deoxy-L-arabinose transferase-like glycosyltransferase